LVICFRQLVFIFFFLQAAGALRAFLDSCNNLERLLGALLQCLVMSDESEQPLLELDSRHVDITKPQRSI
jgi:hypothetical protein